MKHSKITVVEELITPELAAEYLTHNTMNRPFKKPSIQRYAVEMESGDWYETGDPIKFDTDFVLADGQNRLESIVRSGTTQVMYVARGLDPRARLVIDDGDKRSFADNLVMNNLASSTIAGKLEKLLRKVVQYEMTGTLKPSGGFGRLPNLALGEQYPQHAARMKQAIEVSMEHPKVPVSSETSEFIAWLLLGYAPEKLIHRFFTILAIGSLADEDQVLISLRDKFINDKLAFRSTGKRSTTATNIYFLIIGWNAWWEGRTMGKWSLPKGGLKGLRLPLPNKVEM